jgi:hypothetical protein
VNNTCNLKIVFGIAMLYYSVLKFYRKVFRY